MKQNYLSHIILAAAITLGYSTLSSCSSSTEKNDNPSEQESAILSDSTARADAQAVIDAPENSAERERAIIDIRAKESRLRASGYEKAADKYHQTVTDILVDSTGILAFSDRD